jgi:hypothetical protein
VDVAMDTIPRILIEMLERESAQARFVLASAEGIDPEFSPYGDMRSLLDLANHIAQIPTIDFKFYTKVFDSFEAVHDLEQKLERRQIGDLMRVFDEGIEIIKNHLSSLSDMDVLKANLKAFYESGPEKSWAHYVPDITTHLAMHKMQLWMYLKIAGAPVSMWTYYGIPQP